MLLSFSELRLHVVFLEFCGVVKKLLTTEIHLPSQSRTHDEGTNSTTCLLAWTTGMVVLLGMLS